MAPQRETGIVQTWNAVRGFGFLRRPDGTDLFLHIKAFPRGADEPAAGDEISYEVEPQADGKLRAAHARRASDAYVPPVRPTSPLLGILVIAAFVAIYVLVEVSWGPIPLWQPIAYLGVSAVAFGAYAIDKSAARLKRRRIAETSLFVWLNAPGVAQAIVDVLPVG